MQLLNRASLQRVPVCWLTFDQMAVGDSTVPEQKKEQKVGERLSPRTWTWGLWPSSSKKGKIRGWTATSFTPRELCLRCVSLMESRNIQQGVQRYVWWKCASVCDGWCVCVSVGGGMWPLSNACRDLDQVEGVIMELGRGHFLSCSGVFPGRATYTQRR